MTITTVRRVSSLIAVGAALALAAGCSSSAGSTNSQGGTTTSSTSTGGTSAVGDKTFRIAVLVGGASNAYQAAGVAAIKAAAGKDHAAVTVFDAAFDANKQNAQFQTAITSGQYQGILIDPVNGPGLVTLVKQAAAAHVLVAAWNQPIGSDLTTPNPSVTGVTNQAMFPVNTNGVVMGTLTKQACALAKANPCQVADLYFQKGSTYDTGILAGFNSVVGSDPSIKIVAGGDTMATRQGGLSVAQTVLTGHPGVTVMFGTSQAVEGAVRAVSAAHLSHHVYLIGESLTKQGAQMVTSGQLFGGSQAMAGPEGSLALQQLTRALAGQSFVAGINPDTYLHSPCAEGVTKANVGKCSFDFNG